jgi:hypothetical protein
MQRIAGNIRSRVDRLRDGFCAVQTKASPASLGRPRCERNLNAFASNN